MRVLLQRVTSASVQVNGQPVAEISHGLLLLVAIAKEDAEAALAPMAEKILNLRVFPDERGRFHYSVLDSSGDILLIPQFTLYAEYKKGRRPEFFGSMKPPEAEQLFHAFCQCFQGVSKGKLGFGLFGADMQVALVNSGPVTIMLDSLDL